MYTSTLEHRNPDQTHVRVIIRNICALGSTICIHTHICFPKCSSWTTSSSFIPGPWLEMLTARPTPDLSLKFCGVGHHQLFLRMPAVHLIPRRSFLIYYTPRNQKSAVTSLCIFACCYVSVPLLEFELLTHLFVFHPTPKTFTYEDILKEKLTSS